MLYGGLINAAFAWAIAGPPVVEARLGYWLGLIYLEPGRLGARLLALLPDHPGGRARRSAAYSSVLIPIVAMAISTVAEGYRWSALALAGGVLGDRRADHRACARGG